MREIRFRGLRIDGKGWVYGDLLHGYPTIIVVYGIDFDNNYTEFKVMPESIGQFTGLKDKKGKEIYEGDILINPKGEKGIVIWWESGLQLKCKRKNGDYFIIPLNQGFCNNKEIIGKIHENK